MNVLIAGCGYVGTRLGLELTAAGHQVWGLRRDTAALPKPIEPIEASLLAQRSLSARLPAAVDAVVYAAAPSTYDEMSYRAIYVDGLINLLTGLRARQIIPRRVIFCSSSGVYHQSAGEWVDEGSPTAPSRASGQALLAGERLLVDSQLPAVVVRFSGIYGPGRTRLIEQCQDGTARRYGPPPRWTNRIHRDDCAGFLAYLLGLDSPATVYLATDDEPATHDQVVGWLATTLGLNLPPIGPPLAPGRVQGQNKRCRNQRLRASGYQLRYPTFRQGYAALLGAMAKTKR